MANIATHYFSGKGLSQVHPTRIEEVRAGGLKPGSARITLRTMRLSVVVPCFNEQHNIARVVAQAASVGRRLASELEIIVVDDGSTDETARVLNELRACFCELDVVTHLHNRGYGAAVRSGFERASLDYVFLTDGDGQFVLDELADAVPLLDDHDVVAGYRVDRRDGTWRRVWGNAWTALVNWVFDLRVRDANCAFKLLPQTLLRSSQLRSEGALISAELLFEARRSELRVAELAVSHLPRQQGRQTGASAAVIVTAFIELALCLRSRLGFGPGPWLRTFSRRLPSIAPTRRQSTVATRRRRRLR